MCHPLPPEILARHQAAVADFKAKQVVWLEGAGQAQDMERKVPPSAKALQWRDIRNVFGTA